MRLASSGGGGVPCPENLVGYSFIIKGKVGRGRASLSLLSEFMLPSSAPPPG